MRTNNNLIDSIIGIFTNIDLHKTKDIVDKSDKTALLDYINKDQYDEAILDEIKIANDINLFDVDASYIAELARQDVIERYGLKAYKEGWSVYTTIDSYSQNATKDGMLEQLFLYDKRLRILDKSSLAKVKGGRKLKA